MVAFLARMHLAVSDLVVVSGGGGCCDQGGIDHGAGLEQQAALAQNAGDHAQHLLSQFVFLQSTAEPKDGGFIGQPGEIGQLCTLPVQGNIEEGLFHGRISQGEPLLQEVCVSHGLQRKGRPAGLTFGVVLGNQRDQFSPRHHPLQPNQELGFGGFLRFRFMRAGRAVSC